MLKKVLIKINFKNLIYILNIISAASAFIIGFAKVFNNSSVDNILFVSTLKFFAGSKFENAVEILAHNYSLAFSAYFFSLLTFGITGIFFLFSGFLILGATATKTNSLYYFLFIIFESFGFLFAITSSINARFVIKENGLNQSKRIIVCNLLITFILLMFGATFESQILTMSN